MMRQTLLATAFALAMPLAAAAVTMVPPRNLGELASRSEAVVLASAGASRTFHRGPLLFTATDFSVERSVSGPLREGFLFEVEVPGGRESGGGWLVEGAPRFAQDQTYLLLLRHGREGRWRPEALAYGLLERVTGPGGAPLLVPLPEASQVDLMALPAGEPFEAVETYGENALVAHLEAVLKGRAAWDAAAADGAVPPTPALSPPSICTFMNDGYNLRWNIFDGGSGSLDMKADAHGDASVSGGGFSQVQGAVAGWMGVPDTSLNLVYGGSMSYTLACTSGDDAPPSGVHIVIFNDPCSDMTDLSSCTGVLAFGGPWYGGTHTFDGDTWYSCQSWFVVVNNGTGCIGTSNYQLMVEHELGHGLGFGHYSDPGSLMYAYCCNHINSTDTTCAQYAYPGGSPPSLAVALSASPSGGPLPLAVTFTAGVSGNSTGPINYAFWWNCNNPSTSIGSASNTCGGLPNPASGNCAENENGVRCNQVTASPKSVSHTYSYAGTYNGKVIVERGTAPPAESRIAVTVTGTPPAAPTNLLATALSSSQIDLTWKDNSPDELGFKLERKTGISGDWSEIVVLGANRTSYQNAGLTPSTSYSYRIRSYGPGGDSAWSNEVGATTQPGTFTAVGSASQTAGIAPLLVQFTGEGRGGQSPYIYGWDFGDASPRSGEKDPSHTYTAGGTFDWLLTVTDASSKTATAVGRVEVGAPLAAVAFAEPLAGDAPLTVGFAGSATGGTSPYTFFWTFGDGGAATTADAVHTYADPGLFTVTLEVRDGAGQSASSALTIHATTPIPPPIIALVQAFASPFRLRISGLNFHPDCTVRIDGQVVPQLVWKSSSQLLVKGGSALKALVPKGKQVQVSVTNNDDGGVSGPFSFTR